MDRGGVSSTGVMREYDCLFVDLDGVVYRGPRPVTHAVSALNAYPARKLYVTNNASRTPETVSDQLAGLGLRVGPDDIVTSAQAAATYLATLVPAGAYVLVTGGEGLVQAVRANGLCVTSHADEAQAVVQGYSPKLCWADLAEASYALARGIPWVASNTDMSVPTARGIAPGNGTFVAAVASATGRTPEVTGKPHRPIMDLARQCSGAQMPLVIGDRLDTDIASAHAAGFDSLMVLTGVNTWQDLLDLPIDQLPTMVAPDLRVLNGYSDAVTDDLEALLAGLRAGDDVREIAGRLHQATQTQ